MNILILETDRIYRNANEFTLEFHRIPFQLFKRFDLKLREFNRLLGENKDDEYWKQVLYYFKNYKFLLAALPLSPDSFQGYIDINKIRFLVRRCKGLYPQYYDFLSELYSLFQELIICPDNPLLNCIDEYFDKNVMTGILLRTAHNLDAIQSLFQQRFGPTTFEITSIHKLRKNSHYDRLFIIGPYYWYPSFVYDSPRSREIHTFCFEWLQGKYRPVSFLDSLVESTTVWYAGCTLINHRPPLSSESENIDLQNPDFEINFGIEHHHYLDMGQVQSIVDHDFKADSQDEVVPAKLLILNGNFGIFFEENSIPNIQLLSLDAHDHDILLKVPISEVSIGSYILLRTGTEKDYVAELADNFLGEKAELYRKCQLKWKNRMRKLIRQIGINVLEKKLLRNGSKSANDVNIRNWASNETICPRYYEDFLAIMKSVQLEEKAVKFWKISKKIQRAHRKAGFLIRKQLLNQIVNSNLSKLELEGKITFKLPEASGASFTAFRVENIVDEVFYVPIHKVKEIFALEK